jgi:peptidyl-prolyl cis-trans isomerase C
MALLAPAAAQQSPSADPAAQEIRVRQILVETEAEAKEIAAALKAGGDFAELVKRSKEVGAVQRGGDLGYMIEEDTMPAFWAAISALAPGQIAEPLQTEFGWHVFRMEDKRDRTIGDPRPPRRR